MTLTKIEIVNKLNKHIGFPKVECIKIVESFFDIDRTNFSLA